MPKTTLEIILNGKDNFSSKLRGVNNAFSQMATIAGGILGAQVFAQIGRSIRNFAEGAVQDASNLNEALNATSVVFGEAAGKVQDFGKQAADSAGLSAAAFNQLAAQSGAMLQNFGLDASTAADETIKLTQRAADMASIFNTDVNDAFVAINAALRGEADPIERFGVSMNALAVDAKALELGFKKVNGQFTNEAKTQARLALLYEQTDKIAGDFVNTSDQLANGARVQQARWENFMASLGQGFLPVITKIQGFMLDIGERIFPVIIDAVGRFTESLGPVVDIVAEFVDRLAAGEDPIGAFANLAYYLAQAFGASEEQATALFFKVEELVTGIQNFATQITTALEPITNWISENIALKDVLIALGIALAAVVIPAIVSVIASMLPIIAVFAVLTAGVALVRKAWETNWGGIQEKTAAVLDWLRGTLLPFITDKLYPWLKDKMTQALTILGNFWKNVLQPAIQAVWNWMSTVLIPFIRDVLYPWLQENVPAAIQTLTDFWTNVLKPALDLIYDNIKTYVIPIFEAVWELFNVAGSTAITALSVLWDAVLLPAMKAVWEFIDTYLMPIIRDTLLPILEGAFKLALENISKAFQGIQQAIKWVIDRLKEFQELLRRIRIPKDLTPGSPTPFELGLRGIADAMDDLNRLRLPQFNAQLSSLGQGGGAGGVSQSFSLTINEAGRRGNIIDDYLLVRALAKAA